MPGLPDPRRSRAVLVGASKYTHLDPLPAVGNNLAGLRAVLIDPALGGLAGDRCMILPEPASSVELYKALRGQCRSAQDTLLVYFAGHGRTGDRNELYLCLPDTDPELLSFTALAYNDLRKVVTESPAVKKVVILDCCFSGRALADLAGGEETIAGQVGIEGSYILTATAANAVALAPCGAPHTAFTGALLELLRTGIRGGPELLTFAAIFPNLRHSLASRGFPAPRQQGSDTIAHLSLVRNAAYVRQRTGPQAAQTGPARILAKALQTAQEITMDPEKPWAEEKTRALSLIARAMAVTDPGRAERIAREITSAHDKMLALAGIARAMAVTDPDRAERIAQEIIGPSFKVWCLTGIARAVAATDPRRAERLAAGAERIARANSDALFYGRGLAQVARAVVATDPGRAERLATEAERIARTTKDKEFRSHQSRQVVLGDIASAVATYDPDRAERIARSIRDKHYKAEALFTITPEVAATDPDRAERIARSIQDKHYSAVALDEVAKAVAATDPDRAKRLATDAERIARTITDHSESASLARVAKVAALTDPDRAERIALMISDKPSKVKALVEIAEAMATTGSHRPA